MSGSHTRATKSADIHITAGSLRFQATQIYNLTRNVHEAARKLSLHSSHKESFPKNYFPFKPPLPIKVFLEARQLELSCKLEC